MTIRAILREPLLHFLLLGLALFMLYGQVSPGDADSKRVVVSQGRVDDMARQYQSLWGRPPSDTELGGLVDSFVHDEILFREGLAMGLDRDDAVIKRRVRQKYDLIAEEAVARSAPTDADLNAWLKAHPKDYLQPAVVSFEQLFFDAATASPEQVTAARTALAGGARAANYGQPTMLPRQVTNTPLDLVARDFGEQFAGEVARAPVGLWSGPLVSGFGVHLVRVNARTPPHLPPLDAVRAAVARDWENNQRQRARDTDYAKLRVDYDIVVEAKLPVVVKP